MAERRRCAQVCWSSLEGDRPGPISVWPHDRDMSRSKRDVVPMAEYHPEAGERILTADEWQAVIRLCSAGSELYWAAAAIRAMVLTGACVIRGQR